MKKLRLLSLLLVLCFVSALALTACDDAANESSAANDSDSNASAEVSYGEFQDSTGRYMATLSGTDYTGKTFTFLTCSVNTTYESEILYNPYADSSQKTYVDGLKATMSVVLNESLKLRTDAELLAMTAELCKLTPEQRKAVQSVLSAFNSSK